MVGALRIFLLLILRLAVFETHENCPDDCCLSEKHWELIRWFFNRIPFIEVTEISENNVRNVEFADTVMHELWQSNQISKTIFDIYQTFSFQLRPHF